MLYAICFMLYAMDFRLTFGPELERDPVHSECSPASNHQGAHILIQTYLYCDPIETRQRSGPFSDPSVVPWCRQY